MEASLSSAAFIFLLRLCSRCSRLSCFLSIASSRCWSLRSVRCNSLRRSFSSRSFSVFSLYTSSFASIMVSFLIVSARFCASSIIFLTMISAFATFDSAFLRSYVYVPIIPPAIPTIAVPIGIIISKTPTEFTSYLYNVLAYLPIKRQGINTRHYYRGCLS